MKTMIGYKVEEEKGECGEMSVSENYMLYLALDLSKKWKISSVLIFKEI